METKHKILYYTTQLIGTFAYVKVWNDCGFLYMCICIGGAFFILFGENFRRSF